MPVTLQTPFDVQRKPYGKSRSAEFEDDSPKIPPPPLFAKTPLLKNYVLEGGFVIRTYNRHFVSKITDKIQQKFHPKVHSLTASFH